MRLYHIVCFGLLLALLGLGVQFIQPNNGLQLWEGVSFEFPTFKETFLAKENIQKKKSLAAIIAEDIEDLDEQEEQLNPEEQRKIDSTRAVTIRDSIRAWQLQFHYPEGNKSILYPLFETLNEAKTASRPVHILHYGDSQIEGDRMTAYIRHKIQDRFGGSGPGWLPAVPLVFPKSYSIKHSENWRKAHFFGLRDSTITHKRFGAMAIFGRFCPYPNDSIPNDTLLHEAWITYKSVKKAYDNTKSFRDFRMFYGQNTRPVLFQLFEGDSLIKSDTLRPTSTTKVFRHRFNHEVKNIQLKFKGYDSPDIYGVSLDGTAGVQVNNIAMRGNSGTDFRRLAREPLAVTYAQFDIRLVILQYGGNVLPFAKTDKGVESYAHRFEQNINYLKKLLPNASFIVIGPSDMSLLEGTEWITYPMLPKVRDELKEAAFNAGVVYWDLYEAMGGNGAMKEWVKAEKPLAIKDHVHFTNRGARKTGQWFFNALIKDFQEWESSEYRVVSTEY